MKFKNSFLFVVLGMLFVACSKEQSIKELMINSWQTTYLKIEMVSAHNSDSLQVYEDKFDNDPELVAQSQYNKDGTFSAWFKNRKGEKIAPSKGTWDAVGDSLFVEFNYGGRDMKVSYHIEETKEGFIGKSKYDWDEDGDFDDMLTMKTKRIKE